MSRDRHTAQDFTTRKGWDDLAQLLRSYQNGSLWHFEQDLRALVAAMHWGDVFPLDNRHEFHRRALRMYAIVVSPALIRYPARAGWAASLRPIFPSVGTLYFLLVGFRPALIRVSLARFTQTFRPA